MNLYAGIVRNEERLNEGLARIGQVSADIDAAAENGIKEYYIEASRRLVTVARLIIMPALMRKESRGGHYREDYPCSDESYAVHSVQQGDTTVTFATSGSGGTSLTDLLDWLIKGKGCDLLCYRKMRW
jgi:aspartate oxidase